MVEGSGTTDRRKKDSVKRRVSGKGGPKSQPKTVECEIVAIEKGLRADTKSVMFDEGAADSKLKLVHMEEDPNGDMMNYYKKMVLQCMKCNSRFDHETRLSGIEYKLTCPSCGKPHLLEFKPSSRFFTVHSKTVDVIK